jgi:hypothetical protein
MMFSIEDESPPPCKRHRSYSGATAWNEVTVLKPERKAVLIGKDKSLSNLSF